MKWVSCTEACYPTKESAGQVLPEGPMNSPLKSGY